MFCFRDIKLLTFLTTITVLTSCSQKELDDFNLSDQALQIKANQGPSSGNMNSPWADGDSFGLFIKPNSTTGFNYLLEANRKYTFSASNDIFKIEGYQIFFPRTGQIDFIAYAPYNANITSKYPIDVSNQSNLKAIDLLYSNSTKNISKQESPVSISLDHQLTKIVFTLRSFDNTTSGLENVNIALKGFHAQADFDLASGVISNATISTNPISTGLAREAIVIPNTNLANKIFSFAIDGGTYDYTLPTSDAFEKGKVYNYLITIINEKITVSRSNITQWITNSSGIDDSGSISTSPMEYVYIPSGTFQMGAPDTAFRTSDIEKPQHWVKISKGFYMSKYETTIAQYVNFLNAIGAKHNNNRMVITHTIDGELTDLFYLYKDWTPYFDGETWKSPVNKENYPMSHLSWDAALAYAKWVGGTLPTEAQWEYAYRASTKTKFYTGNQYLTMTGYEWLRERSMPEIIGTQKPNPWGLHDIGGNVREWTLDQYTQNNFNYPINTTTERDPRIDPLSTSNGSSAMLRGGDYNANEQYMAAYNRSIMSKKMLSPQIGFRVVINP